MGPTQTAQNSCEYYLIYIKSLCCGKLEDEACNLELYHLKKDPEERNNLVVSPLLNWNSTDK